ncbi:methylated-DNA--[protein]-cysteine S-methyltransferase [Streptomyces sp. PTM05]|uniref:Methylated-DNA--protein-cysteine methyltransferase n=1 Tax=Streptantibioticus parmotrematis TaxID=2873249 RepID=A0ABS7R1J0_9ACTN|nr:methylated-DNA--[protein]-cysteine S-methyltransferase [Streptantibioticus parmotrematis]MBY8889038.1 methylated-DNA--[protein]-cysteine S-methyltransferase [Streptantibioticus parmotrematis]
MSAAGAGERVHTVIDSPYDPLTLVAQGEHLVGLYMVDQRHRPEQSTFGPRADADDHPVFAVTRDQLQEYFAGHRDTFDLPLMLRGTAFQQRVWAALREIPYGETWTYGELAHHIGQPSASRAVGLANGKNPVGVIVPCHRVVGSDGSLTGYGGGLERKRALLEHERALAPSGAEQQTLVF